MSKPLPRIDTDSPRHRGGRDTPPKSRGRQSSTVARPTLLRQLNERAVFETIRQHGVATRADLTRWFDVSSATISKAVANLLKGRLLEEVDIGNGSELSARESARLAVQSGRAGRPGKLYRLASDTAQILGATIDVRQCCVLSSGLDGRIDHERLIEFATPGTYDELIGRLVEGASELMGDPSVATLGLGISVPGSLDTDRQQVLLSPNLHMIDGTSPATDLHRRLGLDTIMFHETVGTCLAEQAYGAARGLDDFVMIGVYEGFGVSTVCGGRLLTGHHGMAGEFGHITVERNGLPCGCGNRGCLETRATDIAFARDVSRHLGRNVQVEEILRALRDGEIAIDAIEPDLASALEYLAIGVAAAVNIFNPEAVLVCSRLFEIADDAFDRMLGFVRQHAMPPLLSQSQIIRAEGNVRQGAVASIIDHLVRSLGPRFD